MGAYRYPSSGHDYHPSWDYDVVPVPRNLGRATRAIVGRIRRDLLPRLGVFKGFSVFYAKADSLGGLLGKYVSGTHSHPVIVLDAGAIDRGAERYDIEPEVAVETTILHELGHALQEAAGVPKDEDQAENFAEKWYKHEIIKRI